MSRAPKRRLQGDAFENRDKYNSTIASVIADIVRFSTDDAFRVQCYQLMKVDNTNHLQIALREKLETITTKTCDVSTISKKSLVARTSSIEINTDIASPGPSGITRVNQDIHNLRQEDYGQKRNVWDPELGNKFEGKPRVGDLEITDIAISSDVPSNKERMDSVTTSALERTTDREISASSSAGVLNQPNNTGNVDNDIIIRLDPEVNFWPDEQCCQWSPQQQKESEEIELSDNDTEWK